MDWQQIIGFYHLAKLGSFTKAAEATFRTQSALSQQIKALEAELDCQLVERIGTRKLRLTPAGERLLVFAREVLEKQARLLEDVQALKGVARGRLSLAAPFTTLYHLLPRAVQDYLSDYGQVQLTLLDRTQERVIALLKSGDVDLGVALESRTPPEVVRRRWHKVETVLLAPAGHPLAAAGRLTLWEIARYPLILPPADGRSPTRIFLEERFKKLGITHRLLLESTNVELTSRYVEMGLGLGFASVVRELPELAARKLEFLPLNHYFPDDYLAVLQRRDKVLSPFQEDFVQRLLGQPEAVAPDPQKETIPTGA